MSKYSEKKKEHFESESHMILLYIEYQTNIKRIINKMLRKRKKKEKHFEFKFRMMTFA